MFVYVFGIIFSYVTVIGLPVGETGIEWHRRVYPYTIFCKVHTKFLSSEKDIFPHFSMGQKQFLISIFVARVCYTLTNHGGTCDWSLLSISLRGQQAEPPAFALAESVYLLKCAGGAIANLSRVYAPAGLKSSFACVGAIERNRFSRRFLNDCFICCATISV